MFMQNAWYVAAWTREIGRDLLARRICDRPMVLYRKADGGVAALEDLCCHRMLPLSKGKLEGDNLVCGYHGLTYDCTGACVRIPSQEMIPATARVASFPIVEKHRFAWVWIGDARLADPALVPDLHWNDDPAWSGDGSVMLAKCDYRLLVDNLLDLSHETYVHTTSIGDARLPSAPITVSSDANSVSVSRFIPDHEPAPFWARYMERARGYTSNCDRWQVAQFIPPCSVAIDVGVAEAGTGAFEGDRSKGISAWVINSITPADADTCWYFWANARDFARDDQALTVDIVERTTAIFAEDKAIVEAQHVAMKSDPTRRMININLDAASVRARRIIASGSGPAPVTAAA